MCVVLPPTMRVSFDYIDYIVFNLPANKNWKIYEAILNNQK